MSEEQIYQLKQWVELLSDVSNVSSLFKGICSMCVRFIVCMLIGYKYL